MTTFSPPQFGSAFSASVLSNLSFDELIHVIFGGSRAIVTVLDHESDGRIAIAVESLVGFYEDPDSGAVVLDVISSQTGTIEQVETKSTMQSVHELIRGV